jgi:hypothetical protein
MSFLRVVFFGLHLQCGASWQCGGAAQCYSCDATEECINAT